MDELGKAVAALLETGVETGWWVADVVKTGMERRADGIGDDRDGDGGQAERWWRWWRRKWKTRAGGGGDDRDLE